MARRPARSFQVIGGLLVGPYFLSLTGILPGESGLFGPYKQAFGTLADIIFLVVSPEAKTSEHLQMLAAIALIIRDEKNREALRQAADAHDVLDVLRRATSS